MKRVVWYGYERHLMTVLPQRALRLKARREAEAAKERYIAQLTAQLQAQLLARKLKHQAPGGNA